MSVKSRNSLRGITCLGTCRRRKIISSEVFTCYDAVIILRQQGDPFGLHMQGRAVGRPSGVNTHLICMLIECGFLGVRVMGLRGA